MNKFQTSVLTQPTPAAYSPDSGFLSQYVKPEGGTTMGRMGQLLGGPVGPPEDSGLDRRDFVKACMMAAAAVGLPAAVGQQWAEAAEAGALKPSVIWLHFQECTG
jgi:hypothetical protein